jgi:CBS domain-containing protein
VMDKGKYVGMVTLESLIHVPQDRLNELKAKDIMSTDLPLIYPEHTSNYVMEKLNRGLEILPVVDPRDNTRLLGVVSDSDVLKAIQMGKRKMRVFG